MYVHICGCFFFWSVSLFAFARICFAERGHVHGCFDKEESRTKPHLLTQRGETIAVRRFTPRERSSWLRTDGVRQQHVTAVGQQAAFLAAAAVLVLLLLMDV